MPELQTIGNLEKRDVDLGVQLVVKTHNSEKLYTRQPSAIRQAELDINVVESLNDSVEHPFHKYGVVLLRSGIIKDRTLLDDRLVSQMKGIEES